MHSMHYATLPPRKFSRFATRLLCCYCKLMKAESVRCNGKVFITITQTERERERESHKDKEP